MSLAECTMEGEEAGPLRVATDDHVLTATPWPMLGVVSAYLYFVLHAGPRMMRDRPALRIQPIIIAYNLFVVVASSWYVIRLHTLMYGQFNIGHCKPRALDPVILQEMNNLGYIYFLSKILELLDTVFFVLRKKMNQVTFLHVYHHTNMAILTWYFLKMVPASQLGIIASSNTAVHILMYGYYLLAALGPSVQKYLWWKKYLTRIQMFQFLIIIGYMTNIVINPACQVPKMLIFLSIINTSSFLVLFAIFYSRAYSSKGQVKSE